MSPEVLRTSRAPSLHGHYPASSLLRAHPPPSRRPPVSQWSWLSGRPSSADFAAGRGGLLQLLVVSWSPCCRSHPAGGIPPRQPDCEGTLLPSPSRHRLGPRGLAFVGATMRSRSLRPGDSLTILTMACSMGFRTSVSRRSAIQATGRLALAPAGLSPAGHCKPLLDTRRGRQRSSWAFIGRLRGSRRRAGLARTRTPSTCPPGPSR